MVTRSSSSKSSTGRQNAGVDSTGNRASVGRHNTRSSSASSKTTSSSKASTVSKSSNESKSSFGRVNSSSSSKSKSGTFSSSRDSSSKSSFGRVNAGTGSTGNRASVGRQNAAKSETKTESKAPQKGVAGGKRGYGQKTDTSGLDSVLGGFVKAIGSVFGIGDDGAASDKIAESAQKATASIKGLKGNAAKNANVVRNELKKDGYSDAAIAGFLGRVQQESGFSPVALRKNDAGPGKHSYGIGQWNRGRLSSLKSFAREVGGDYSDISVQAKFMAKELRESPDERRAFNTMKSAQTIEDGAVAGMHYERPRGYSAANPRAGHGWDNTVRNARNFAGSTFADASDAESNDNPFSAVLGKAVSFFGGEDEETTTQTAYRDPDVVVDNGGITVDSDGVKRKVKSDKKRSGLVGLTQMAESGDVGGVIKGVLGAVLNPVGLAIDTVDDIASNGVISGGGASALAAMGGSSSNPFPATRSGRQTAEVKPASTPVTPAAETKTAEAVLPPALGELLFQSGRKPFWWSTLT